MKKTVLCIIVFAFHSLLLNGAQSPHSKEDQKHKHAVKTDNDLLNILQQTRKKQREDSNRIKDSFDTDLIQYNENKKG